MKKYIVFILLSVIIAVGCSTTKENEIRKEFRIKTYDELDRDRAGELGVKTRKKVLYLYDADKHDFKSEGKVGETIFWDESGNISKIERYNTYGEIHTRWEYEYDDRNNRTKLQSYDEENTLLFIREMKYDSENNEIQRQERRTLKGLISFDYKTYNEYGQITKRRMEDQNGELIGEEEYIYENHLLKEIINKNINGDELGRRVYEYDDRGNLIAENRVKNGQTMNRLEYKYDDNNNLIKINFGFYYTLFDYNENGQVISEQIFLENGKRQKKVIITYTENGLIDEIIDYSPTDEIRHKFKYVNEYYN